MRAALADRDMGAVFRLARQYTGCTQARIAAAAGLGQGRANEVFNGRRRITGLDVLERCAVGLAMPDHARLALGLAPDSWPTEDLPSQSAAADEIRAAAATGTSIDLLAVRGLGLIALNDSLLQPVLTAPRETTATVRVLLLDPESPAAAARAAAIGESAASFAAGIRMALARLAELAAVPHLELAVATYDAVPLWRIIRVDDTQWVSVFGAAEGHQSAVHRSTGANDALHEGFVLQFAHLWAKATAVV